jgi:HTH-type transcriptional regulator, sugar sensing transcriptional regulator
MEVIEQLQQLGFSQYEAQAYIALLQNSPLNGYELAKVSAVPRANIYNVLQKLEDAGAVVRVTSSDTTRYASVPANEFLATLKSRHERSIEAASASLQEITSPPRLELVSNLQGYAELLDQANDLIKQTERHLLLSIWPEEALILSSSVQRATERGVKITTLCLHGCAKPCPACRGAVYRYAIAPAGGARWLVLVSDENELLAGEIRLLSNKEQASKEMTASAVRTRQQMLVNLTASYIQNSIALVTLMTHFGNKLYSELDTQSIDALNDLKPLHSEGKWLEVLESMLHREQNSFQE